MPAAAVDIWKLLFVGFVALVRIGAALAQAPAPQSYALLVGAAHYAHFKGQDLEGPPNDVALWRSVLEERGFRQIVALDAVGHDARPVRAEIIDAMRHLAAIVHRGDFVFMLFSGHGSQQPEGAAAGYPSKPDGMDETFLPTDIGPWSDDGQTVARALLDHEVGSLINGIRNKGAFVWSVFDSCHSATMTRAVRHPGERDRRILPAVLGVPPSRAPNRSNQKAMHPGLIAPVELVPGAGGAVAFYAAETTETTPEEPLPEDAPDRKVYGLFSYTLAQAVQSSPAASYRQLAQQVLQSYAAANRLSPRPLFEGGADLDRVAFGSTVRSLRQWSIQSSSDGMVLAAGQLHGVGVGSLLLVLPSPSARNAQALGVVRVTQALETESYVDWVSDPRLLERAGWTPPARDDPPPHLPRGAFARLAVSAFDVRVRVSRPVACSDGAAGSAPQCRTADSGPDASLYSLVLQAIDEHAAGFPASVVLVDPSSDAEINPELFHGRLWLASKGGQLVTAGAAPTFSLPLPPPGVDASRSLPELRAMVFDALAREARAIVLARLAEQSSSTTSNSNRIGLHVALTIDPASSPPDRTTPWIVTPEQVPDLHDGDSVTFELTNAGDQPIDVTMLDIGARFGIRSVYPLSGELNRLPRGATVRVSGVIDLNRRDGGLERMLVIGVPVQDGWGSQDFSDLAQAGLGADRSARQRTRAVAYGVSDLDGLVGGSPGSRAPFTANDPSQIVAFSWNAIPPKP